MNDKPYADDFDPTDPTPEQIDQRSAAIRRGWSKRVAERRKVCAHSNWLPPLLMTGNVVHAINEHQEQFK